MRGRMIFAACLLPALVAGIGGAGTQEGSGMDTPVDIGTRVEMFVDSFLIARRSGVELRLHPPERREIVLVTDKPWEGKDSAYYTVFHDGARIRLYYRGHTPGDLSGQQVACYAESDDGIRFSRPSLSQFDFGGSKENNIIYRGVEAHNFAPFLDANPAAPPEARYKALGGVESRLYAFASPDGLRWRRLQEEPVMTQGAFDSLNVWFWDPTAKVYRSYSRNWTGGGYEGYRAIQNATSPDFLRWSTPQPNRYADPQVEHFYTNATVPCPGAEHILLSFPKRFVPERTQRAGYKEPGVSDAMFMSSRDGVNWDRTFREAWLRPGRDEYNWTQRSNMVAWGIVQTAPDEFSLYISEHYGWPDNRLRRLVVRRHGFASVHAGAEGGEFVTRPLRFAGRDLLLNYATSAAGSVQVEAQDENGTPLPGYALSDMTPMFGDDLDGPARWKGGGLSALIGKPVRFRFVLKDADLYALRTGK